MEDNRNDKYEMTGSSGSHHSVWMAMSAFVVAVTRRQPTDFFCSSLQATQADITQTRSDLQGSLSSTRDALNGSIAKTHDELALLEKRGDREYSEFDALKSNKFQHTGPLSVSLRKTDPKHEHVDLMFLVNDRGPARKLAQCATRERASVRAHRKLRQGQTGLRDAGRAPRLWAPSLGTSSINYGALTAARRSLGNHRYGRQVWSRTNGAGARMG